MDTREMLAVVGVTLAVITAYSPTRDLTDEPPSLHASQTSLMYVQVWVNAPHR